MSSSISNSSRQDIRRFLIRLFVFAALLLPSCVIASWVFNSGEFDGTYITAQNYKLSRMNQHLAYDIIVMGDSCPMAIDVTAPKTVDRLGKLTIFNFALVNLGGMYPLHSTLKKYLSGGAPPQVIVLSFLPSLLAGKSDIVAGSKFTKFYAAKFYSAREMVSDPVLRSHPKLVAQLFFEKYKLRFMQYRYDIPRDDRMILRLKATSGQLLVLEDTRATEEQVLASTHYHTEFVVSDDSDRYFTSFLELARQHGVKVLLFDMPVPPSILLHRRATGYYASHSRYLEQVASKFDNFNYLSAPFALSNEYFSSDVTHLNRAGTDKFQKEQWPFVVDAAARLVKQPIPGQITPASGEPLHGVSAQAHLHPGAISSRN